MHPGDKSADDASGPIREQAPPITEAAGDIRSRRQTTCCVVGGGPAGVMLSYLLARADVPVTLLEAHKDFDRKFRGDTLHPSILEVLDELGLADELHQMQHSKIYGPTIETADGPFRPFDFRRLKTKFPYIMVVPQSHFLQFVVDKARRFPTFHAEMGANVQRLLQEEGAVTGVGYRNDAGMHEVRCDLTVAADGRFSRLRNLAGIEPVKTSPPMDVLWFNLPHLTGEMEADGISFRLGAGRALIVFDRFDHWQAGYIFAKGQYQELHKAGLDALKSSIVELVPGFDRHVETLCEWQDLSLLSVESSRCRRWYADGLLLIGDAAHVMSPVGGVGINYAIHDAVEAANILAGPLKSGEVAVRHLHRVQKRRERPTRIIQFLQAQAQKQIIARVLRASEPPKIPWYVRLLARIPMIRDIPARLIAFGIGRSHVKS